MSFFQDVFYEIDRRLGSWMNLLLQIPLNQLPKTFFTGDSFGLEHLLLFLERKTCIYGCDWNRITQGQSSSKRSITGEDFDLDTFGVDRSQFGWIPLVIIVKMYALTRFAELSIRRWPLTSRFEVSLKAHIR